MNKDCLNELLDHKYGFTVAQDGTVTWVCWNCGDIKIEFEDSHP